jgi:hypothetical protein
MVGNYHGFIVNKVTGTVEFSSDSGRPIPELSAKEEDRLLDLITVPFTRDTEFEDEQLLGDEYVGELTIGVEQKRWDLEERIRKDKLMTRLPVWVIIIILTVVIGGALLFPFVILF